MMFDRCNGQKVVFLLGSVELVSIVERAMCWTPRFTGYHSPVFGVLQALGRIKDKMNQISIDDECNQTPDKG